MKAVRMHGFGGLNVLTVEEVTIPSRLSIMCGSRSMYAP